MPDDHARTLDTITGETVTTTRGTDGALVVTLDTTPTTGRVRIRLNDGIVYDADPEHPTDAHADAAAEYLAGVVRSLTAHPDLRVRAAEAILAHAQEHP